MTSWRHPLLGTALKEVLEPPATLVATNGKHLIGAGDAPMHGGMLEAMGEDQVAAGLDDVAGGAKLHSVKFLVAHPSPIAFHVADAGLGFLARVGVLAQRSQ